MPRGNIQFPPPGPSSYTAFAKLGLVRKLPYKQFGSAEQTILKEYFDLEPFFDNNKWTIYVENENDRPIFLVPIKEVWQFFDSIERETGIEVQKHPKSNYCQKKNLAGNNPTLVGVTQSKAEYDAFLEMHGGGGGSSRSDMTPEERAAEKAARARRAKEKRKRNRHAWGSQIKEASKLLGFDIEQSGTDTIKPLFVCVDVESWEKSHAYITEIGVASLDAADLPPTDGIPRTYDGIKRFFKYRHFRVRDHMHLKNGQFVSDNAERFDFGKSEAVPLKDIPAVIAGCFRPRPLPRDDECNSDVELKKRQVVFIGHDAKTDIDYLQKVGYDVRNIKDLIVYDTGLMYKVLIGELNTIGLSKMATALGLEPWNLHNAGNDAAFTLQSFVKIAEMGLAPEKEESDIEETTEEPLPTDPAELTASVVASSTAQGAVNGFDNVETQEVIYADDPCITLGRQEAIERFIMGSGSSDEFSEEEVEEKKMEKKRARQERKYLNNKKQRSS